MISTKGRYALRLMVDLASQGPECYVPLKDIAERQDISEKYMENIVKELVQAKLLVGLRGKGGGYKLIRPLDEYSVGEILTAAGEQLSPVACLADKLYVCNREATCPTISMWKKFDKLSHDFFYGITLADLC